MASDAPPTLWARSRDLAHESWKYLLVSVAALAVDFGLLILLTEFGHLHYLASAAMSFLVGLFLNYALSVTLVFRQRRLRDRRLEFLGFFAIGLIGLGLNEVLMKLFVESFGLGYALAKIPATAVGFVFNFGSRRVLLFTGPRTVIGQGARSPRAVQAAREAQNAIW